MSKPWNPRLHLVDARRPYRRQRSRTRISWSELRLALLGGLFLGLIYLQYDQGEGSIGTDGTGIDDPWAAVIVDGDTFRYHGEKIRIADIDTPEVKGRCEYEIRLAAQATARMEGLLHEGSFEMQPIFGRDEDRYGRKLRIVTRNGDSLGDQLVSEGLARTWTGRRQPWC